MKIGSETGRRSARMCAVLAGLVLAGCGGSSKPAAPSNLAPVSGTVTVGGKPVPNVVVTIVPTGTTKGTGGWGKTDDSGTFKVLHQTQAEGVEPGEYMAVFSLYVKPDGQPLPPNTSPTESRAVQAIPAPWSDPATQSPKQRFDVPTGGTSTLAFDLPVPKVKLN